MCTCYQNGHYNCFIKLVFPKYYYYENLTTCPVYYSCIMDHMVKGRQYSTYTVQTTLMSAHQSQGWSLKPTLNLDTDNFQSQETNSTAPYMHIILCSF